MSKFALALIIAVTVAPAVAAPPPRARAPAVKPIPARQPLPIFDFMGQNTETVSTMTALNAAKCDAADTEGKVDCTDYNDPTVGGVRLNFLVMNFYKGKLYSVFGTGGKYTFPSLLSAFTAKYGTPKLETRVWQNRMGAKLDNPVAIWHFRGGNLELASIGSRIDDVDFMFISGPNSPPAPPPKVDF
jgi:hypothetical protein